MRFSHRIRVRLIGLLSMALLFSQFAVAAYACPALALPSPGPQTLGPRAAMAGMPCADMAAAGAVLDVDQPALCQQHCHADSASPALDPLQPACVSVTALPPLFTVLVDDTAATVPGAMAGAERRRDRPPPLAHSIAHCCFRI